MRLVDGNKIATIRDSHGAEISMPARKLVERSRLEAIRAQDIIAGKRMPRDALMLGVLAHAAERAEGTDGTRAQGRKRGADAKSLHEEHQAVGRHRAQRCSAPAQPVNLRVVERLVPGIVLVAASSA